MIRRWRPWVLAAALACAGCTQSISDAGIVDQWMECTDCSDGQLDSVRARGRAVVPRLAFYVRYGPPAARVAAFRARSDSAYARLLQYLQTHPDTALHPQDYTDSYAGAYHATYVVRSAQALSLLGGAQARGALDSALAHLPAGPIRDLVELARDSVLMP